MANGLDPILTALYNTLSGDLKNTGSIPLNSDSLGTSGAAVLALFQQDLGVQAIILGAPGAAVTQNAANDTVTVSGQATVDLAGITTPAVTATFSTSNQQLEIAMAVSTGSGWTLADSFPMLGETIFGQLTFATAQAPLFVLLSANGNVGNQYPASMSTGLNLSASLELSGTAASLAQLIPGIVQPLPLAGPVSIATAAESLNVTGTAPGFSLSLPSFVPLAFTQVVPALIGTATKLANNKTQTYTVLEAQGLVGSALPLAVQVALGVRPCTVGLQPNTPLTFAQLSALFSGLPLLDVVPDPIKNFSALELTAFGIQLSQDLKSYTDVSLVVSSNENATLGWDIIPGIVSLRGISVGISVSRDSDGTTSTTGSVTGTFTIGSVDVIINILLPLSAGPWTISSYPNVALPKLDDFTRLLGGNGLASMMPANFADIGGFSITLVEVVIDPVAIAVQSVSIGLASTAPWKIVPSQLELSGIGIFLQIVNPFSTPQVVGSVSGTLTIESVAINVKVYKSTPGLDWMLGVFVDPFTLTGLGAFEDLTHGQYLTTMLPQSLQELNFTVSDLELTANLSQRTLQTFIVTAGIDNWSPLSPYLELDTLTATLSLDWTSGTLYISGDIGANFKVATIPLSVTASYTPGNWTFVAAMVESDGEIDLTDAIRHFLPNLPSNVPDITIGELSLTFQSSDCSFTFVAATGTQKPWKIQVTDDISFTVTGGITISRAVVNGASQFSGKVEGAITGYFGKGDTGLGLSASYAFQPGQSTTVFKVSYKGISLTCTLTQAKGKDTILTCQLGGVTFGEILEFLISMTVDPGFKLSAPWDVLNKINFDNLSLVLNLTQKTVGINYKVGLNIGIVDIETIGLSYVNRNGGTVDIAITGTFAGQQYTESNPLTWDMLNDPPPQPAAKGSSVFDLQYVGIGQHVSLVDPKATTMELVLSDLKKAITDADGKDEPWRNLTFDPKSNWLFGAQFVVMDTVALGLVFNDPNLYGLRIALSGGKAGVLAGLEFEILYRKVTDTIGVYHIDLKVPDAMRQLQFGEVSITLPIIVIDIYTNGNFRIDFGFPKGLDFSNSFCVQVFPFVGYGGFYFALLNGDTSTKVPKISNGNFSPVIEFGLALSLGVGKTFNEGPLSAGVSVTVIGIVEGVIGWFNPTDASVAHDKYYWIQGTIAIVGKLYGTVDFVVIKASITVTATASVTLTIEAHQPILIAMSVGVSVEASVKFLFFSVSFHFSMTLSVSFTIGSASPTPWKVVQGGGGQQSLAMRSEAARLRRGLRMNRLMSSGRMLAAAASTVPNWTAATVLPNAPVPAEVNLIPALTVSGGSSPSVQVVMAPFIQNNVGPTPPPAAVDNSPFGQLVLGTFLWSVNAQVGQITGSVSAIDLSNLYNNLNDPTQANVFTYDQLSAFLAANYIFTMGALNLGAPAANAALLAMAPPLVMTPQGQNPVDFGQYKQAPPNYQTGIAEYFQALSTNYGYNTAPDPLASQSRSAGTAGTASLATVIFRDYFLILAKSAVQAAQNLMKSYPYTLQAGDSLLGIAGHFDTPYTYNIQHGDTLGIIAGHTDVPASTIQAANPGADFTAAGQQVTIPPVLVDADYITAANDTIDTIATAFSTSTGSIVAANPQIEFYDGGNPVIFAAGVLILVPLPKMLFSLAASVATQSILNPATAITLQSCSYPVQSGDTLTSIAAKFGPSTPATLASLNAASSGLLAGSSAIAIASAAGAFQSTYALPQDVTGATGISVAAAWFYTRNLGTVNAPTPGWFVLAIQALNPGVNFAQALAAGTTLVIPNAYMSVPGLLATQSPNLSYTTSAGDTLAGIAAMYSGLIGPVGNWVLAWVQQRIQDNNSNIDFSSPLTAGQTVTMPLVSMGQQGPQQTGTWSYLVVAGDTLPLLAGYCVMTQLRAADLAGLIYALNSLNPGIAPGQDLKVPAMWHVIAQGDTFDSTAALFAMSLVDLAAGNAAIAILEPHGLLLLPPLSHPLTATDTLDSIAGAYNLTLNDLTWRIATTPNLFAGPTVSVPQVPEAPIQGANSLGSLLMGSQQQGNNVSGIVSRFLLHGLQLPDPADTKDFGDFSLPALLAALEKGVLFTPLYQLTGQQFALGTNALNVSFTLEQGAPQWVQFYSIYPAILGDTWAKIAATFGVNQTLLMQMNSGSGAGPAAGQQVKIPASSLSITATQAQLQPYLPSTSMSLAVTPQPLQLAETSPVLYTLSKQATWQAAAAPPFAGTPVVNPVGPPSIWFFPTALVDTIEAQSATHPYALATGTQGDVSTAATPVSAYDWATIIPIAVQQVPGSAAGSTLPNTYAMVGADQNGRDLLVALIDYLHANSDTAQLYLLYSSDPASANPSGYASDALDTSSTLLLQTNLSTETHSGPQAMGRAMLQGLPPSGDYYASLSAGQAFLQFLWECSAVGTGGYYLNYVTTGGKGLPGNLFVNNNQASLSLVVILTSQSAGAASGVLSPFSNCAVVQPKLDASRVNVFASVTDGSDNTVSSTVPPGNTGYQIDRPDPATEPASPEQITESLFSLLQYQVPTAKNPTFESDLIGLPAGPVPPPGGGSGWHFQEVLPVYRMVQTPPPVISQALPSPANNPYAGISNGSQITLTFSFRDVFGNQIGTQAMPSLSLPVGYTDPLIGLGSWPGATGKYSFQSQGGTPQLSVFINVDLAKYVPSASNAFSNAVYTAASHYLKYSQIYYQVMQSDTAFYVRTCFDSPASGPTAFSSQSVQNFVEATCVFLNVAQSLAQETAGAANMADLSSSYSVSLPSLFQANSGVDVTLLFSVALNVPLFYVTRTGDTLDLIATQTGMDAGVLLTQNQTLPLNVGITVNGPNSQTRQVVKGDTAASVAQLWSITVDALAALNLKVVNFIPVGTPLYLLSNAVTPEAGETLTDIATAGGITLDQLAAANGSTALVAGAQVAIPGAVTIGPNTWPWAAYQPANQSSLAFVTPLPTVGNNTLAQLAAQYNVDVTDLAVVNSALVGFLNTATPQPFQSGTTKPQQPITPAANDTLLSLAYRFTQAADADPSDPATVQSIAAANATLPNALNAASQFIVPPAALWQNNTISQPFIPAPIFPVTVSFGVQRTQPNLIHPDFTGFANMTVNETLLAPEVTTSDDSALTLTDFATNFETAFQPQSLKAATGPQTANTGSATNPIWAVSFGAGNFSNVAAQQNSALYYAMQPLSTKLESRAAIDIQPYDPATGTLGAATKKSFQSVDMDAWLKDLLAAVDLFLSPQYAVPAFLVNPTACEKVIKAKKTIAQYLRGQVTPILTQSPTAAQLAAAREALYQSMLTTLGTAYSTSALVQVPVTVTSPYMPPYTAGPADGFAQLQAYYLVSVPYLAQQLANIVQILNKGSVAQYNSQNYTIQASDTIGTLAAHYGVSIPQFAGGVTMQGGAGLFAPGVTIPLSPLQRPAGSDSFATVAVWFGASAAEVAIANQNLPGIFQQGLQISVGGNSYTTKATDNLLNVAAGLKLQSADQVATAASVINRTGLFNPTATLTACDDNGRNAPRLSGKPLIPLGAVLPPQGSSFSTAKIPLTSGGSLLTFLFSTPLPEVIKNLATTLEYVINEMEYNVNNVPGIAGYQSSDWLSFIVPLGQDTNKIPVNGDIGGVNIPIPLRAYPKPPLLIGQAANFDATATDIADAKLWDFSFTTQQTNAAQDQPYVQMKFNDTGGTNLMFAAVDPFPALAQFADVYSQMKAGLSQLLLPYQPAQQTFLQNVVDAFATVIDKLAQVWGGAARFGRTLGGVADTSYLYEATYAYAPSGGNSYYSTLTLAFQSSQPVLWPNVSALDPVSGNFVQLTATPVDPKTQSYSFGSLQIEELSPITLTFDVPQFDVTVTQNGWGGAYVKRNQGLTNLPTNPAFIYQTPLVRFNDTVVPFIVNQEIIPLNGDFQTAIGSFFAQLLLNQQQPAPLTNSYAFKLTLYYSHTLLPSPGPGLDPIVTMVPVVFEPQMQLTPAYGITQFAADLWSQADTWIGLNNPILAVGDSWSLEITMFSSLTGQTTMPVLEMTRLTNTITGG